MGIQTESQPLLNSNPPPYVPPQVVQQQAQQQQYYVVPNGQQSNVQYYIPYPPQYQQTPGQFTNYNSVAPHCHGTTTTTLVTCEDGTVDASLPAVLFFLLGFCFPLLWCFGFCYMGRRYNSTTRAFANASIFCAFLVIALIIFLSATSSYDN